METECLDFANWTCKCLQRHREIERSRHQEIDRDIEKSRDRDIGEKDNIESKEERKKKRKETRSKMTSKQCLTADTTSLVLPLLKMDTPRTYLLPLCLAAFLSYWLPVLLPCCLALQTLPVLLPCSLPVLLGSCPAALLPCLVTQSRRLVRLVIVRKVRSRSYLKIVTKFTQLLSYLKIVTQLLSYLVTQLLGY